MAKDLVNNPETKLGGAEKPYMDLGDHLEYIESLLEQGAGGAGGKSVPPTLNLFDLDGGDSIVRTTITEEEKTNLENGLYNQVIFPGPIFDGFQLYMPSKLIGDASFGVHSFAQFSYVASGDTITINALSLYSYSFGAKDTNGNYPITVEKSMDIPIGGNSGGGNIWYDLTSLNGNSITQEQYNEIKSLIDGNRLAGIKTVLQFFPLVSENNGEFKFAIFSKGYEQIDSNKKLEIDNIYFTIKPDLSITNTWDTTPVVELTKNLSSQSIPSIKTDGYQQNLTIGDGLIIENGTLKATGGGAGGAGGKSVPPTLNLFDFNGGAVRTTITEEEYNNLKNGLYNQVIYNDGDAFSMYSPSKLFSIEGGHYFTQFKIFTNVDETFSYSSMILNAITIGEKNTSNEYPITVTDVFTINPPSASGGSNIDKLNIEFTFNGTTTLTSDQVTLINSYANRYVYVKFNEGIVGDNVYLGYVFSLGDLGTIISIVSQPNISGDIIIQSAITIKETTATHKENTIEFSIANSGKFLKTNAEGNPEWASIPVPTITFED